MAVVVLLPDTPVLPHVLLHGRGGAGGRRSAATRDVDVLGGGGEGNEWLLGRQGAPLLVYAAQGSPAPGHMSTHTRLKPR